MFQDQKKYIIYLNSILDAVSLVFIFFLLVPFIYRFLPSYFIDTLPRILFHKGTYGSLWNLIAAPALMIFSFLVMLFLDVYQKGIAQKIWSTSRQIFIPCVIISCVFFLCTAFFSPDFIKSAVLSAAIGFILWALLALNRLYIFQVIRKDDYHHYIIKHILIVGTDGQSEKISQYIISHPETGLRIAGFLTNQASEVGGKISNHMVLGLVSNLQDIISNHYTDCVLFSGDSKYLQDIGPLIDSCAAMGIDFATSDLSHRSRLATKARCFAEQINGFPIIISKFVYQPPGLFFIKRLIDFTASLVLIFLCLPLYIPIAFAVRNTSPGPILYRQKRIGKYGRKFILYKFRSMVENAEELQTSLMHLNEMDGPVFKIKYDPRETRTGKFLRKTALDEMPQLFNVFKGDISLVGPRPALEKEVAQYRPESRKRLSVMQGITCTWQANGRNEISFREWMKLDRQYIQHWSLATDFRILLKTFRSVSSMMWNEIKKFFR